MKVHLWIPPLKFNSGFPVHDGIVGYSTSNFNALICYQFNHPVQIISENVAVWHCSSVATDSRNWDNLIHYDHVVHNRFIIGITTDICDNASTLIRNL